MTTFSNSFTRKIKNNLGYLFVTNITIPRPELYTGPGALAKLPDVLREKKKNNVLIVTDDFMSQTEPFQKVVRELQAAGIKAIVFNEILPDPPASTSVKGAEIFVDRKCDCILAYGGGSSIDCAKLINLVIFDMKAGKIPRKEFRKEGFCKRYMGTGGVAPSFVPQLLVAVPTTAGTGSEATSASVISFPALNKKYFANDPKLVSGVAILDPELLVSLPKGMTAATGVDALTHAIESFLGEWSIDETKDLASKAVSKIFRYLVKSYNTPDDLEARQQVLLASYEAGCSFTRANVGYVHAIAHQFGALFHIPHGLANAMILPKILDFYYNETENELVLERLAHLYKQIPEYENLSAEEKSVLTNRDLACRFILAVKKLNDDLNIPKFAKGFSADLVSYVGERALREAHGTSYTLKEFGALQTILEIGFPVPKILTFERMTKLLAELVDPSAPLGSKY